MNYCRTIAYLLLALIGLLSHSDSIWADEPLSMKVEMRNGKNGPKKMAEAVAGEDIFFAVAVEGLTLNEAGKLKFRFGGEIRSEDGELLHTFPETEKEAKPSLGPGRQTFRGVARVPEDYAAETVKHVAVLHDLSSGTKIQHEFTIKLHRPTSPFPFQIGYWLIENRDVEASGSGRFTTGDRVELRWEVGEIKDAKSINCKVEFIRKGESKAINQTQFTTEIPRTYRIENRIPLFFEFVAGEPFDGFIVLTVTDEGEGCNSAKIPLLIEESLGSAENTRLAELPKPDGEQTKKE